MAQRAETLPQARTAQPHRSSTSAGCWDRIGRSLPFILPIIILMTIFIAWPFIRAIFTSMTIRTMARETKFVGLDNYIRLYSDPGTTTRRSRRRLSSRPTQSCSS
ncbi:MAG: hypothetical protein R2854_31685 [Caldilineaceae bacterium]